MRHLQRLVVLLAVLSLIVPASPAAAYSLLGCKYLTTSLKWLDVTTGTYTTPAQNAISAWDATATPISFTKVTVNDHLKVGNGNFGNTGYDGITLDPLGRNPTVYWCGGGTWDGEIVTWWNTFYADGYSATKRKSVMVHEIGHALGLAHRSVSLCTEVSIMQPDTRTRYDICGKSTPQADDVAGVNFIY